MSMTAVPDRTLNLPSGARSMVRVQPSHIKRVSDAPERAHGEFPPMAEKQGRKRPTKKDGAVGRGSAKRMLTILRIT